MEEDDMEQVKNAGLIMGTNNSSIVSKRSVERLYLPEPHFYRYFVRKPQRRSPTINRGYWLRMRAVDWVIRQFLEKSSEEQKVIINLGCGYDPVPFQWMAREPGLCHNTKFIDVDYEELMVSKRNIISVTPRMKDMLSPKFDANPNYEKAILLDSVEYSAIGCDLRNIPRLDRLIKSVVDIEKCLVLCVAEVSITYMQTEAADAVIAWASTLSPDVTFCLLEQGSPDRPDNPFTQTMIKHFEKLGTPLHSVFDYPGHHAQGQRFAEAGFSHCECQNLWELWADHKFLSISQRLALDRVEPFDEWEEFALFASHYLLVVAQNRTVPFMVEIPQKRRDSSASLASNLSARTVSPYRPGAQWFTFNYCKDTGDETKRHHASTYQLPDQDAIATYGGIGPKGRLSSSIVCRSIASDADTPVVPPPDFGSRCCHTVTTLINGQNILIGGRGSPTQPKADCWIQTGSTWKRIHDLPEPRYRHRAMPVTLPDNTYGAVVFGGKVDASRVAVTTLLWGPRTGWEVLRSLNEEPIPRFGASFVHLGFNHGLLFGGMRQDGIVCQGFWRWRLVIRDTKVAGISFRQSNALDASVGSYPWFARMGASHGLIRDELLVIGGIAKSGCIPKPYEMLSVLGSFSAFNDREKEMQLKLTSVDPPLPPGVPRPFLVGHATHRTKTGMLVVTGGGATCFSFGNYFNSGVWIMHERESGLQGWQIVSSKPGTIESESSVQKKSVRDIRCSIPHVPTTNLPDPQSFLALLKSAEPSLICGLDYGSCSRCWNPSWLASRISPSRSVVIHKSPLPTMNFQRKDFAYETVSFSSFIDYLTNPQSHVYLRSLSTASATNKPANFFIDYPEIVSDFHFPPQMCDLLSSTIHSSPLRVSNNITMFLHYDVMSNILFQMHGTKKLILFPPTDITKLSFPPGSTTSTLDIFSLPAKQEDKDLARDSTSDSDRELIHKVPEGTSPQVVILEPGQALYIPALWAHTGISLRHEQSGQTETPFRAASPTPSTGTEKISTAPSTDHRKPESEPQDQTKPNNNYTNIALNVFFRSLPPQTYAAGRDVYANRDLAAYEDGRRDLEKIVRRFVNIPSSSSSSSSKKKSQRTNNEIGLNKLDRDEDENGRVDGNRDTYDNNDDANKLVNVFDHIPRDMARAYLDRLADELKMKAREL